MIMVMIMIDHDDQDDDHLVDVKVEALFHPALRLLELLLQVHHLIINNLKPYCKK